MSTFNSEQEHTVIVPPKAPWQNRLLGKRRPLLIALVAFFCLFDTIGFVLLAAPRSSAQSFAPNSGGRLPGLTANAAVAPATTGAAEIASPTAMAPQPPPGVYVTALETNPASPRRGQNLMFDVQILNTGSAIPSYRWAVFLFRPADLKHPLGQTPVGIANIPNGSVTIAPGGTWKLTANGPCEDVIAQVGHVDGPGLISWLAQPGGQTFQERFTLCP